MDKAINPAFWNWSHVYVRYCDGASFSGLREDPLLDSPKIYSRGNYILKAVITELFRTKNSLFSKASHVVVGGTSAGALTAYLHAHQIREILPSNKKIVVIPDSGFFPLRKTEGSVDAINNMDKVYNISQAKNSLPKKCIESKTPEAHYHCMFAENVVPYIPAPILILNSRFDSFVVKKVLGYRPGEPNSATITSINKFGSAITSNILTALHSQKRSFNSVQSGAYVFSCSDHIVSTSKKYAKVSANGVTVNKAVQKFVANAFGYGGKKSPSLNWISKSNFGPTCAKK